MLLLGTLLTLIPPAVTTFLPPHIRDPCQTVKCRSGYYCDVRPTPCSYGGPCTPVAVCVKEPPSNPGQCPRLTGLLRCNNECRRDIDCGPELKCCSHRCGRKCVKPQPPISPRPQYPCSLMLCAPGFECRLRQTSCSSKNCPVNAECVPSSIPPPKPRCKIGRPVLDRNNAEWDCGNNKNSRHCPGDTVCNTRYGVCCFNDRSGPGPVGNKCDGFECPKGEECRVETIFCITTPCPGPTPVCRPINKIGSCPGNLPIQSKPCRSRCSNDADCAGTMKCCGGCRRECVPAAPPLPEEKPGSCPKPTPGVSGACIAKCSLDSECPGTEKCCGNCPRECKAAVPNVPKEKPGSCPKPPPDLVGICIARCQFDSECPGTQKCCGNCPRDCTAAVPTVPKEKPGSCPIPTPGVIGPCIAKCTFDSDCAGTDKCCGSCPRQCTAVPIVPKEKPGSCPKPPPGLIGICIARCTFDSDCEGNKKCCGGCPRECTNPASLQPKEKPGTCPKPIPGTIGPCIAKCSFDSDCSGDLKCCGSCPRLCTAAVSVPREKPGFCPISPDGGSNICVKECTDDFSCPRDSKCCVSGCRRTCRRLLLVAPYVDSDPCSRMRCRDNQVCKLREVVCVRAPCFPSAVCVAKSPQDISSVCSSGYPVLSMDSKPLSCSPSRPCPDGTSCVKQSCCWNRVVKPVHPNPTPGSCPVVYGRRFLCRRYSPCRSDVNCPSGRKCCRVGRCGKRCLPARY